MDSDGSGDDYTFINGHPRCSFLAAPTVTARFSMGSPPKQGSRNMSGLRRNERAGFTRTVIQLWLTVNPATGDLSKIGPSPLSEPGASSTSSKTEASRIIFLRISLIWFLFS